MGKNKSRDPVSVPTLDLHGVVVDEVFDLMDRFLRTEEGKGADRVRILHGRGTGKIREKALEYCRLAGHDPKPDTLSSQWGNPGSFLLYL